MSSTHWRILPQLQARRPAFVQIKSPEITQKKWNANNLNQHFKPEAIYSNNTCDRKLTRTANR